MYKYVIDTCRHFTNFTKIKIQGFSFPAILGMLEKPLVLFL